MSFHPPVDSKLVPPEAVERLQRKFTAAKSVAERERFWAGVQARKPPQKPVDFSELPIG